MSRSFFDAVFGRLLNAGTELELLGGINFVGFTIDANTSEGYWTITNPATSPAASDVDNDSATVSGTTVADALDALQALIDALTGGVPDTRTITAGAGLTGGGDLSANRTLDVAANADGTIVVNANDIQVGVLVAANYAANTIALSKLVNATGSSKVILRGQGAGAGAWTEGTANDLLAVLGTATGNWTIQGLLNGVTLASPVEGGQITTTATINVGQGNNRTVTAAGGAYAITLGTTGSPLVGEIISLICSNALANAVTVTNGGGGGGNIGPSSGTMPAAVKGIYDYRYDGTNWAYVGVKRLQ